MASKNYNSQNPKYITDFSKALSGEVRILLDEVGKLRDERRALQFEIAELMALKSKHGAGGAYQPDWRPQPDDPPALPALPPPEGGAPPPEPTRPAWRVVHKRPERKLKAPPTPKALPAPLPVPLPESRPSLPSWAQWRPNPALVPAPVNVPRLSNSPPPRTGLFGSVTPPPK